MNVSDTAQHIVAAQMQMLQNSMSMAAMKTTLDHQQQLVNMVTENTASAAASANGRGAVLDILV